MTSADAQLDEFLAKFTPEIEAQARSALDWMRGRLPGAVQLVYDNYNALVVAFGASEKLSGVVFSIAVYPRWVNLFFARGVELDDPTGVLRGSGTKVRHLVLRDVAQLDTPEVDALISQALIRSSPTIDANAPGRIVIKAVSAKQRPRRS